MRWSCKKKCNNGILDGIIIVKANAFLSDKLSYGYRWCYPEVTIQRSG